MEVTAEQAELVDAVLARHRFAHSAARLDLLYDQAVPAAQLLIERCREEQPLGHGGRKVVYALGEDKAVGFFCPSGAPDQFVLYGDDVKADPKTMILHHYYQKIGHALLPEHVPDIYLTGSSPGIQITERVHAVDSEQPVSAITAIKRLLSKLSMKHKMRRFGLSHDGGVKNILYDESGTAHYVDDVDFPVDSSDAVEKGIHGLPERERVKAMRWLQRVREIGERESA